MELEFIRNVCIYGVAGHLCVQTIGHQFELPVRWDEGYGSIVLKAIQTHALVKLYVFELYSFNSGGILKHRSKYV